MLPTSVGCLDTVDDDGHDEWTMTIDRRSKRTQTAQHALEDNVVRDTNRGRIKKKKKVLK